MKNITKTLVLGTGLLSIVASFALAEKWRCIVCGKEYTENDTKSCPVCNGFLEKMYYECPRCGGGLWTEPQCSFCGTKDLPVYGRGFRMTLDEAYRRLLQSIRDIGEANFAVQLLNDASRQVESYCNCCSHDFGCACFDNRPDCDSNGSDFGDPYCGC